MKRPGKTNKTASITIRMTQTLKAAIVECAKKRGNKLTDWIRYALANAVEIELLRPDNPPAPEQEAKE